MESTSHDEGADLSFVRCAAHHQHPVLGVVQVVPPPRDGALDVRLVAEVLVDNVVLAANQDPTGPVVAPRDGNQEVGGVLQWFTVLPNNVVQPKVKLIESKCLERGRGGIYSVCTK